MQRRYLTADFGQRCFGRMVRRRTSSQQRAGIRMARLCKERMNISLFNNLSGIQYDYALAKPRHDA